MYLDVRMISLEACATVLALIVIAFRNAELWFSLEVVLAQGKVKIL